MIVLIGVIKEYEYQKPFLVDFNIEIVQKGTFLLISLIASAKGAFQQVRMRRVWNANEFELIYF